MPGGYIYIYLCIVYIYISIYVYIVLVFRVEHPLLGNQMWVVCGLLIFGIFLGHPSPSKLVSAMPDALKACRQWLATAPNSSTSQRCTAFSMIDTCWCIPSRKTESKWILHISTIILLENKHHKHDKTQWLNVTFTGATSDFLCRCARLPSCWTASIVGWAWTLRRAIAFETWFPARGPDGNTHGKSSSSSIHRR